MNDNIKHPNHYTWHPKIECKDVTGEFSYNIGTAIAYLWRCGHKHNEPAEDLVKAIQHIKFELERIGAAKESMVAFDEIQTAVSLAVSEERRRMFDGLL